jgi:hypothetical protein
MILASGGKTARCGGCWSAFEGRCGRRWWWSPMPPLPPKRISRSSNVGRHFRDGLSDGTKVSCPRYPGKRLLERLDAQTKLHVATRPSAARAFCYPTPLQKAPGAQSRIITFRSLSLSSTNGMSDNDGMGDPHQQRRQHRAFPTATTNGIISAKRRGVRASPWEKASSLISPCTLVSMKMLAESGGGV